MKKVQIITRHSVQNYGSFLQAFATQAAVEKLGYEAEIVDYVRDDERVRNIGKTLLQFSSFKDKSKFMQWVFKVFQTVNIFIADRHFAAFRSKYLKVTKKRFRSIDDLKENAPSADIYMTGSDQLWGVIGNDKLDRAYFLDYAPSDARRVAYAASFGVSKIDDNFKDEYNSLLSRYSSIGVREDKGLDIVKHIGFDGVLGQVLDPTLLLKPADWEKALAYKPIKYEKYILVYQIHHNPDMDKYAEEFAEKADLPLYRITPNYYQLLRSGKTKLLPAPDEFLSFISGAEYFITDSFHGTAFSLQYHTRAICISSGKTMSRLNSLLKLTGMQDRVLSDFNDFHYIGEEVDFSASDIALENERDKSWKFLKNELSD